MGSRAAFFDLDRTLIPGSSLFLLARGLYDRDLYRVWDILRFGMGQLSFRLSGESEKGLERSRTGALEFVQGRTAEELRAMGREIAEERILPRVYEGITRVIEQHQHAGDLTYLATAAPVELAGVLADALGMSGTVATVGEVDEDGRYTGRLVGDVVHGPRKAEAVRALAEEMDIDLSESYAYSDSINDLPLMESVGHPIAVNPDSELRVEARRRGWPVYELRTKRLPILIGIPSAIVGVALFGGGVAVGGWLGRKRVYRELREFVGG
ncbi:MAG TPA: HAD-IB family hydrolase [Actinomycetota bacterium]|nr:HAD-IB family hydrolase [Actinomycetota bacterium]